MFNKKIAAVLAAVAAALTLAACGAQDACAPASVSAGQSASSTSQTTESKGKESASAARDKSASAESEKTAASSSGKSAASGSTEAADSKTVTGKATGGETPASTQTNTGKTGTNQTDSGKTGTSTDSKTPAATPAPGSNTGTGHNPNEGGAIGGGNTTIPGDGSWAVDGGNATPDTEAPDLSLPQQPGSGSNSGTGNNPNAGGAGGQGEDYVIPGDGSWAVDGGNAEIGGRPTPAPVAPVPDSNIGTGVNPNEGGAIGGGNTTVPGDGSWAVDGGNATPGEEIIPPPPVTDPGDNTVADNTPPSGGIIEGGLDNVIPGGITDQDGGNAEYNPAPLPPEPAA